MIKIARASLQFEARNQEMVPTGKKYSIQTGRRICINKKNSDLGKLAYIELSTYITYDHSLRVLSF